MKYRRSVRNMLLLGLFFMTFLFGSTQAEASWLRQGNSWYYYDASGNLLKNQWIGNYYVGSDGRMLTNQFVGQYFVGEDGKYIPNFKEGWYQINKKWYYYTASGKKWTGWLKWNYNNRWYYLNNSGVMQTGWVTVSDQAYYFNAGGIMAAGQWMIKDNVNYYIDAYGRIARNAWIHYQNSWYYVKQNGIVVYNSWYKIGGQWYYFQSNAVMAFARWIQYNQNYYYVDTNGAMVTQQFVCHSGLWYYLDQYGVRVSFRWKSINGKWYYFHENGVMATGWLYLYDTAGNNFWYYLDSSGAMYTGWIGFNNHNYYLKENGLMARGWTRIQNRWYYFNDGGVRKENTWIKDGKGDYYYLGGDGQMATGFAMIGGKLYYFNNSGVMLHDTIINVSGESYSINANGVCTPIPSVSKPTSVKALSDFLFFTWWKFGCDYSAVGENSGYAFGYYQFDCRYELHPLIAYCYTANRVVFAEFAPFASGTVGGLSLRNNEAFNNAWRTIWLRDPHAFAAYQDAYMKYVCYNPVANELINDGIDLNSRPDVVKGVIFSCATEYGRNNAIPVVLESGVSNSDSNAVFITKIYRHRMEVSPAYAAKYEMEMEEALSRL